MLKRRNSFNAVAQSRLGANLPTIPSDRFDLAGAARRAQEFADGRGCAPYEVWVRAVSGVSLVTGATCGERRVDMLNDLELPDIADPWSVAGLDHVVGRVG